MTDNRRAAIGHPCISHRIGHVVETIAMTIPRAALAQSTRRASAQFAQRLLVFLPTPLHQHVVLTRSIYIRLAHSGIPFPRLPERAGLEAGEATQGGAQRLLHDVHHGPRHAEDHR